MNTKTTKPLNEQEERPQLFKLLPQDAINELPIKLVQAYSEWENVNSEWEKAYNEWIQTDKQTWHKKWCGCLE